MDNRTRKAKGRKTVIKPPKKATQQLSRDEVRSINKKKMSRRRKLKKNLLSLVLAAVVFAIGMVLVFALFFKISVVEIQGENIYSDKMIVEKSGIEMGKNLFGVNEKKLSERLSTELPYIKTVTLDRKLPDTLVINVVSTREVAAVVSDSTYVLIDEAGKVLDKDASVLRENVAVITNVKIKEKQEGKPIAFTDEKKTQALTTILQAIKNSGLELLTEINLKSVNDVKIVYDDRITFEVGSLTNIETKLARGKAALEKENEINAYSKGTLDLKTEPYVYFKSGSEDAGGKENAKKQQK